MKKNCILLSFCVILGCGSSSSSDRKKTAVSEKKSVTKIIAEKNVSRDKVASKSVKKKNITNIPQGKKIASQKRKNKNVKSC